jgi:hypothetical protein
VRTDDANAAGPRVLVRLDLDSRAQVALPADADVAAVTSFALAPSKRALAVADGDGGAVVALALQHPVAADGEEDDVSSFFKDD